MDAQRTLRRHISCVGIGLHSGNRVNLTLRPAPADFGIRFRRTDLGHHEVPATVQNLAGIQLATGLASNEVSVETVEHLLAALVSVSVDNVIIELNSPEVPIMDGSAAPFIYLIHEAGVKRLTAPRKYLKIVRPIAISRGDKRIALYPSDHFKVTYSISYDHPLLRHQSRTLRITEDSFVEEIGKQYVMTARAKGLGEPRVLYGHVFRNAMLIVIAGIPGAFIHVLFAGSLLIEVIFSLDGVGLLGFESALNRDYPVMFGTLYFFGLIGLFMGIVGDLMYTFVDPRIDFEARG